jgi:hypothetical protein
MLRGRALGRAFTFQEEQMGTSARLPVIVQRDDIDRLHEAIFYGTDEDIIKAAKLLLTSAWLIGDGYDVTVTPTAEDFTYRPEGLAPADVYYKPTAEEAARLNGDAE